MTIYEKLVEEKQKLLKSAERPLSTRTAARLTTLNNAINTLKTWGIFLHIPVEKMSNEEQQEGLKPLFNDMSTVVRQLEERVNKGQTSLRSKLLAAKRELEFIDGYFPEEYSTETMETLIRGYIVDGLTLVDILKKIQSEKLKWNQVEGTRLARAIWKEAGYGK